MNVYMQIMDSVNSEKKNSIPGQLSLFDFAAEEEKDSFEIKLPNLPEFEKEELLAFEKIILYQYLPSHYGHCQISSSWIYKTSQDTNHLSPNSQRKVLLKLKLQ